MYDRVCCVAGLLIKQMLVDADDNSRYDRIVNNTRGIVFYSVPHRGSELASYAQRIGSIYAPSVEVIELAFGTRRFCFGFWRKINSILF